MTYVTKMFGERYIPDVIRPSGRKKKLKQTGSKNMGRKGAPFSLRRDDGQIIGFTSKTEGAERFNMNKDQFRKKYQILTNGQPTEIRDNYYTLWSEG